MNILLGNMEVDWWNELRFGAEKEKERQGFAPRIIDDYVKASGWKCEGEWCNGGGGQPTYEVLRRTANPRMFISWCGGGEVGADC